MMDSPAIQILANAISTATVLSCLFLKVPQIMYMKKKKSAEGIYIQAMLMEITGIVSSLQVVIPCARYIRMATTILPPSNSDCTIEFGLGGFTIVTLYNYTNQYSLMTYLEYPIILVQVYVMLYYTLKFKRFLSAPIVSLGTVMYCITIIGFVLDVLPKDVLSYLVPFCTPLSGSAKVTYIYGIVKAANADAVSRTTWIISILTNISRLFTVYVDSADVNLMINFTVSTILSTSVLGTAIYYQTYKSKKTQQRRKSSGEHCHCHDD